MKKFRVILILLITVLFSNLLYGQDSQRDFGEILQTYYLHKDKDLVEKTIEYVNDPKAKYEDLEPLLTGFFGALFSSDTAIRNEFLKNIDNFQNQDIKQLFSLLSATNIDSIYAKTILTPEYNDMNWASYFATGDVKFLDNIISNIPLAENRVDLNLFLTGASAKWSLCSNARQDKQVKKYLSKHEDHKKEIKEILKKEPHEFKLELLDIITEQRAKGIWK